MREREEEVKKKTKKKKLTREMGRLKGIVTQEAKEAFESESAIIDWMINGIKEEGLDATTLKEFVKNRINNSLEQIGFPQVFEVDKGILSATMWFEEELLGNNMTDFFKSRPVEYSKNSQSFGEDDLF